MCHGRSVPLRFLLNSLNLPRVRFACLFLPENGSPYTRYRWESASNIKKTNGGMYMEASKCALCAAELTGAIETRCVSLRRAVMITMIETSDCNWARCLECKTAVCKRCFFPLAVCCLACFTKKPSANKPIAFQRNGHASTGPGDIARVPD